MAHVIAVEVIDQVAVITDLADGVGTYPFDAGVLGHQQEELEQGRGAVAEDGSRARLDKAILDLEALIEWFDRQYLAGMQDRLVEMLQQHVVEARQGRDMAVVALHELLDGETLRRVSKAEQFGDGTLVVEQQAVLGPAGKHVQGVAHLPQEGLTLAQDTQLGVVHEAGGHQVAVAFAAEMSLGDPADHLDIAQPAGRALDIGLQVVLGVVVALVAVDLLLPLGLEEVLRRPHAIGGQACLHRLAQPFGAGDGAALEQVGDDREVGPGLAFAVGQRAHAVPDLQADVPQEGDKGRQRLAIGCVVVVLEQQQEVDIGVGVQLAAAIAAHGEQGHAVIGPGVVFPGHRQQPIQAPGATMDEVANIGSGAKPLVEARLDLAKSGLEWRDQRVAGGELRPETVDVEQRLVRREAVVVEQHWLRARGRRGLRRCAR